MRYQEILRGSSVICQYPPLYLQIMQCVGHHVWRLKRTPTSQRSPLLWWLHTPQSISLCLSFVKIKYHIPYPLSLSHSLSLSLPHTYRHSIHVVTQVRLLANLILLLIKTGSSETPDPNWTSQNPILRPQLLARCECSKVWSDFRLGQVRLIPENM